MRIGIKFCGGCNPRYDRSGALGKIRAHFEKDADDFAKDNIEKGKAIFDFAKDGGKYDLLLVICGCSNQCASTDEYTFGAKISIGGAADIPSAVRTITEYRDAEV
jgi:hypothetical protein